MKLALALLTYNHPNLSIKSGNSLLSLAPGLDFFIMHNGSLPAHVQQLQDHFPNAGHLKSPENHGYTGGCNFLFQALFNEQNYDGVFLVTNDCQLVSWAPIAISRTNPQIAVPIIYRRKLGVIDSIGAYYDQVERKLVHCRSEQDFLAVQSQRPQLKNKIPYAPGTAFFINRIFFDLLKDSQDHLFDPTFHTYWEDVDLGQRLSVQNIPIQIFSQIHFVHGVQKTTSKNPHYRQVQFFENQKKFEAKLNAS